MKKKIGIDLDKTLFDCRSIVYTFLNSLKLNKSKKKLRHSEVKDKGTFKCGVLNKICRMLNPKYYFTFPAAVENINRLVESGFEVHIVSNRPNIRSIVALTLINLKKHGIKYDKLVLGCNNKQEYARQEGLDYFIDNMDDICIDFARNTNTKAICFGPKLKAEAGQRLAMAKVNAFATWDGIGEFLSKDGVKLPIVKEKKRSMMIMDKIKKMATNNPIGKGHCLPEGRSK